MKAGWNPNMPVKSQHLVWRGPDGWTHAGAFDHGSKKNPLVEKPDTTACLIRPFPEEFTPEVSGYPATCPACAEKINEFKKRTGVPIKTNPETN